MPVGVVGAKERFPISVVEYLSEQILLAFALAGQLPNGVVDDGDVGTIFVVGVDRVASAMPEDLLDVDELPS